VRATDTAGNVDPTPATRSWTVTTEPPGPGPDVTAPVLSGLRLSRSVFAAASRGGSIAAARRAPVGTTVRYTLSEPATVAFTVQRAVRGRRAGRRCVRPTRRNGRAKRCTRYVRVRGGFSRASSTGLNRFTFTGRLGGLKLTPGRYRLVARARDAAGNRSAPKRVAFRIVRR
jgi:hypothetical protein